MYNGVHNVMVFFDRIELEFIKNEVVKAATSENDCGDKEWLILLAAKLIKSCKEDDETTKANSKASESEPETAND